ncbi:MAG: autotransporter-associated beta strand repeat-containing protein [Luteolibacter sp.]
MKPRNLAGSFLVRRIALSFASSLAATFTASAATSNWDGATSGVWDTVTSNWTGSTFTGGNDALFAGTPISNVTSATGLTIAAITLDNTFTGSVSMTGNNTVSGATTVSGGTLSVLHTGTTVGTVLATDLGTSAITVNSGGIFTVDDTGNGTTAAERILSLGNNISGAGTINAKASALMTNGWSSINFTGDLSGFTGTLNVVTPSTANRAKGKFTTASQSTLLSSSATVNVQNGAQLYLTQAFNYGFALKLNGGTGGEGFGSLRLENTALNFSGPVTLQAASAITTSANGTISGNIGESGGSFGFTKQGANTLVLSGNSSYSGGTTIAAANATTSTLSVGHNNALGTGTVTFSPTGSGVAVLADTTSVILSNNLSTTSGGANLNASGGTMVLNGNITGGNGVSLTPTNKITLAGTNSFATSAAFGNLTVNAGAGGVDITGSTTVGNGNSANSGGYLSVSGNTSITVQSGGSLSVLGTTNATTPQSAVGQNAAGTSTLSVNGGSLSVSGKMGLAFGNNVGTAIGILTVSSGTATITRGSTTATDARSFIALGRDTATGTVNLNGGTLATDRNFVRDSSATADASGTANFNFGGGTLKALANQTDWLNSATINTNQLALTSVTATNTSTIDANGFNVGINNSISGAGGFNINSNTGTGTVTFTGTNTYTGDTTVTAGVLAVDGDAIADTNKLVINGGKLDPMGATEVVGTLYFGATQQAAGTWGSTASGATHQDDTRFTGTGVVSVTTGPVAGYTSWADANGASGQTADQDHDNDGVANGLEYFMGATGSSFTANPGVVSNSVTWPKSASFVGSYIVQTSSDLSSWATAVTGVTDNGTSVVYTLPTGSPKLFVRLVVTAN